MDRTQALRHFQALNRERLQRLTERTTPAQSSLLQLLPLLFHLNAKVLPGYVDADTPAGIADFQPDHGLLELARRQDKNFSFRPRPLRRYPLRGLYLIDTAGQLAGNSSTHCVLWLVHDDKLTAQERALLQRKLAAIAQWAATCDLAMDTRLLALTTLSTPGLTDWERDDFYTRGLVLAGGLPLWWQLSPEDEHNREDSVARLRSQRLPGQASFIDFGAVHSLAPTDIVTAACETVRQVMHRGTGLLSLLHLHQLLRAAQPRPISLSCKQWLYQGVVQSDRLDVRQLQLAAVEGGGVEDEIDLARRVFYLESGERLSQTVKRPRLQWRRACVETLVHNWGWQADRIRVEDQRDQQFHHRQQLYELIGTQCRLLLARLRDYCRAQGLDIHDELADLQLRYRLLFEPAADTIHTLPPSLRHDTAAPLYLQRFAGSETWLLSEVALEAPGQASLYRHHNLIHLLAWAVANRLLTKSNWLSVNDQWRQLTTHGVIELVQPLLRSALADSALSEDSVTLHDAPVPQRMLLFANVLEQPRDKLSQQGLQLSSRQSDPFNYSSFRRNLLSDVYALLQTRHGQWHSVAFTGDGALPDMLTALLRWQPVSDVQIQGCCLSPVFGQLVASRLTQLVSQLCAHYREHPQQGRLLLDVGGTAYVLQWRQQDAEVVQAGQQHTLWRVLSAQQQPFMPTQVDAQLDGNGLINYLLAQAVADRVSLFMLTEQTQVTCFVLDEIGNLVRLPYQNLSESLIAAQLREFLWAIRQDTSTMPLQFFRVSRQAGGWQHSPLAVQPQPGRYLPVTVTMAGPSDDAACQLRCGQTAFEGQADDPALFARIRQQAAVLAGQRPLFVSALRITDRATLPTADYLRHKQRLDHLLAGQD